MAVEDPQSPEHQEGDKSQPEVPAPPPAAPASMPAQRSWPDVILAAIGTVVVCGAAICVFIKRNDADFINYAAALLPGVFSFFFGFIPDVRERHKMWRIGICLLGIIWSVVLWRQQVLSQREQEKAQKHAEEVLKQSSEKLEALTGSVASKLNEKAFLLFDVKPTKPPDENGSVTLPFVVSNPSTMSTGPYTIWIHICKECRYDGEPQGFTNRSGPDGKDRLMYNATALDSLVHTDVISVKFFPPAKRSGEYEINFYYSCQYCMPGTVLHRIGNT